MAYRVVELPPETEAQSPSLTGHVKAAGTGLARGVTGILGTLGDARNLYNLLLEKAGAELTPAEKAPSRLTPTSGDVESAVEQNITGEFYEPQTPGEKYTAKIAEYLPNLIGGPGGLLRKTGTQVIAPAIGDETLTQATEGTRAEPWAGILGALLGTTAAATATPPSVPKADKLALEAITADDLTPESAVTRLQEMGPEGMLADVGPNLTQQAAGIASLPGKGQTITRKALAERMAGASKRVTGVLDQTLGPNRNVTELGEDIINRRSAENAPIWKEALEQPVNPSDWMLTALDDPLIKKGLAEGLELERLDALRDGVKLDPTDYAVTGFNSAGDPIISGVPNMRTMHAVKVGLDKLFNASKNPITGRSDAYGNAIKGVQKRLVRELDAANPFYKPARRAWEGPTKVHAALRDGQEVFRRSVSPDELRANLDGMNASEREAYVVGARAAVAEIMGTARNDAATAWRELTEKGWNREKLSLLLGDTEADTLITKLRGEKTMQNTMESVTRNSETSRRAAAQAELGDPQFSSRGSITGGVLSGATTGAIAGGPWAIVPGAAAGGATVASSKALQKLTDMFGGASQRSKREALAKILTDTSPERDLIIGKLGQRPPRKLAPIAADMRRQALIQALMLPREEQGIRAYLGTPPPL